MDVRNWTSALHELAALHCATTASASSKEYGYFVGQIAPSSFIKMNAEPQSRRRVRSANTEPCTQYPPSVELTQGGLENRYLFSL
jgi:hypothetical protein